MSIKFKMSFITALLLCALCLLYIRNAHSNNVNNKTYGLISQPKTIYITPQKKQSVYDNLKSYSVKEEDEEVLVQRALDVFKKKQDKPKYRKKFWITDNDTGHNASYISFMTNDQNANLIFSPHEEYVYYIELDEEGNSQLTGFQILTDRTFSVANGNEFYIETCSESNESYLLVADNSNGFYTIYDLNGVRVPSFEGGLNSIADFEDVICNR